MKSPLPRDKYFLRSVHQEIDLYDRKLAYLDKYAVFDSPADREEAASRMLAKRATLEKTARELAATGVEFKAADLPRSFRGPVDGLQHTIAAPEAASRTQAKAH